MKGFLLFLFGRENVFFFKSSLCEGSCGHEGNLESAPNGKYHEGRFVPKPLTHAVADIFSRENPLLGKISQRRHFTGMNFPERQNCESYTKEGEKKTY